MVSLIVKFYYKRRCFEIASLGKVERTFSKAFFTTPPESSFEEALGHFEKAFKVYPSYFAETTGRMAICYSKLGNKAKAKEFALKAMEFTDLDENTVKV